MKAVFDTNIYISAFAIPGGRAEAAILKAAEGEVHLVISRAIIHEALDVLARKFDRNPEELARVAVYLSELAEVVTPRRRLKVLRDEPDNRILECAVTVSQGCHRIAGGTGWGNWVQHFYLSQFARPVVGKPAGRSG